MFTSGRIAVFTILAPVLVAAPLFAQRYQEHDHHVFHRPPAATQSRRSNPGGATSVSRTPVVASNAAVHTVDSTRRHELTLGTPPAPAEPRGPK